MADERSCRTSAGGGVRGKDTGTYYRSHDCDYWAPRGLPERCSWLRVLAGRAERPRVDDVCVDVCDVLQSMRCFAVERLAGSVLIGLRFVRADGGREEEGEDEDENGEMPLWKGNGSGKEDQVSDCRKNWI